MAQSRLSLLSEIVFGIAIFNQDFNISEFTEPPSNEFKARPLIACHTLSIFTRPGPQTCPTEDICGISCAISWKATATARPSGLNLMARTGLVGSTLIRAF